ncbi:uridine kinase [Halorubrum vacuolatum]|uniref:Uridine kinase n=1 Tax=Halorubrum vacuolatum TaxID=63740 RepID=A0A238V8V7_HALVU|nr:uridine kinase [Halorubrum vacuolatum]SNR30850.1 uridine kinase [Halorubrum vacuolatum]
MSTPSFVIGIAGGTGAGKTTISRLVTRNVEDAVTRIPLDNYYVDRSDLTFERRRELNYDHPDAFEWDLLHTHLETLVSGQPIEMPQYDFETHDRTSERVRVEPTEVIVLEGILALYDADIRGLLDLKVYVETDADVRILRRIRRDVGDRGRDLDGVIDQYLSTVKPMHERFIEPSKRHADLIIPEGANSVAVDLLAGKLRMEIEDSGDGDRDTEATSIESPIGGDGSS